MIKRLSAGLLLTGLICLPAQAIELPTEPQNFSLSSALQTALERNPSIRQAQARVELAKLDEAQAEWWWARSLNANTNYVLGGNPYGNVTATGNVLPTAGIGIGFNLGDVLNGPRNLERSRANVAIAEAELVKVRLEVSAAVTAAFQEYRSAKEIAALSGELVQAAQTDMRVAERTFERGLSQANSLVGARVAVNRSRIDQVQVLGNVAKTWANLLGLMGDPQWINPAVSAGR